VTSVRAARDWMRGARPQTLALSLTPIVVAVSYALAVYRSLTLVPILAATLSAVLIQVATNLANDSADGKNGADTHGRLGPERLVGAGIMTAARVRRGALVASVFAAAFGAIAVFYGGAPILVVGVGSLIAAWGYSYGPAPISASPLGEAFVILFFGLIATTGTLWLGAHRIDATAALLGLSIGLCAAAVLTVNNHRDRVQDIASGRRTLAILLGPVGTPYLYVAELAGAAILAGIALWPISAAGGVVAAIALVAALALGHRLSRMPISRAVNGMLVATVRFQIGLALAIIAVLFVGAR
jgi:1,4-dihydroxy-2-naphthoate polyprenyltransferase